MSDSDSSSFFGDCKSFKLITRERKPLFLLIFFLLRCSSMIRHAFSTCGISLLLSTKSQCPSLLLSSLAHGFYCSTFYQLHDKHVRATSLWFRVLSLDFGVWFLGACGWNGVIEFSGWFWFRCLFHGCSQLMIISGLSFVCSTATMEIFMACLDQFLCRHYS